MKNVELRMEDANLHYDRENRRSVIIMTLKESVLQGIETATRSTSINPIANPQKQ